MLLSVVAAGYVRAMSEHICARLVKVTPLKKKGGFSRWGVDVVARRNVVGHWYHLVMYK